jgi:hypothetical protein
MFCGGVKHKISCRVNAVGDRTGPGVVYHDEIRCTGLKKFSVNFLWKLPSSLLIHARCEEFNELGSFFIEEVLVICMYQKCAMCEKCLTVVCACPQVGGPSAARKLFFII